MARTIRRQPLLVSTSTNDYPKKQTFNQVDFKGIFGGDNEIAIDQSTFADAENVYIDDRLNLTSRPPVVKDGDFRYCIKEWRFGAYHLVYSRAVVDSNGTVIEYPYRESEAVRGELRYRFRLECVSHPLSSPTTNRLDKIEWFIPYANIDQSDVPKVNCMPMGRRIFIWIANIQLYVLDHVDSFAGTSKEMAFVSAYNHVYVPIRYQVVNGIVSDLESDNFLTYRYKYRYHYSAFSDVNFSAGAFASTEARNSVEVRDAGESLLYTLNLQDEMEKVLVYHHSTPGVNLIDMVQTAVTPVFLRYEETSGSVEVSFDGKTFRQLPEIACVGAPVLSRDGLCVFAFGLNSLFKCKIDTTVEDYVWESIPYLNGTENTETELNLSTVFPAGYFLDEENYVYFIDGKSQGNSIYLRMITADGSSLITIEQPFPEVGNSAVKSLKGNVKIVANRGLPGTIGLIASSAIYRDTNTYKGPFLCYFRLNDDKRLALASYRDLSQADFDFAEDGENVLDYGLSLTGTARSIDLAFWKPYENSGKYYVGVVFKYYLANDVFLLGNITNESKTESTVIDAKYSVSMNGTVAFDGFVLDSKKEKFIKMPEIKNAGEQWPVQRLKPLYLDANSVWYLADDELWTSYKTDDYLLFLDVTMGPEGPDFNIERVPDFYQESDVYYIAYNDHYSDSAQEDGESQFLPALLYLAENRVLDGKDKLYLPAATRYTLLNRVTNLWPLTDNIMGIFTEKELFYVATITAEDGTLSRTKLLKSKTTIGCREGDEIIMAPDGKTILLPTHRGIAAMQASTLIDTSSQSITYISDPIYHLYSDFYVEPVMGTAYTRQSMPISYVPMIKSCVYRHFLFFYKYMDRTIFVFDTKNSSWWKWRVPYPIRKIDVDDHLYLLLEINFTPFELNKPITSENVFMPKRLPYLGVKFKFANEYANYVDEIIDGALNGIYTDVYENEFVGTRAVVQYATPRIDWHFTSQRLHFGQINNYKCVKSIGLMLKGDDKLQATLETKAYRDFYHPEYSDTFEIEVNEQRTFVKHMNLMHLTNFQYTLKTSNEEKQIPLKINSVCIKYEVKEAIR